MSEGHGAGGFVPPRGPRDLQRLTAPDLRVLASEIRRRLVDVVAANGGHLAPNLGVVELTIALHRVFQSPEDKIIWDVGHQSYVHKLLTGRWEQFSTLRLLGGLAGFPRRQESPHDAFDTGHASTSISAALGLAKARDIQNTSYNVVAVIGDGAIAGGMAMEALNHAGQVRTPLVIVLNDNSMSIARSVGGLAAYLGRVRTHPLYSRTKQDLKDLLNRLPGGQSLTGFIGRLKTSLKYLLLPGLFFEELGLTYLGPVDGHNLAQLEAALGQAKLVRGPVVVHCLTRKGKGYLPAESNPNRFHGVGPFDPQSGEPNHVAVSPRPPRSAPSPQPAEPARPARTAPAFTEVFSHALLALARKDSRICAITAAMADGTGLRPFMEQFPARAFDVGIAEQHAVTLAAGLAAGGMRPVVAVYSSFLQRAYDQLLHDVCLQGLPVVLALDRAGLVGEDGPTHHGLYDLAYLRPMPGLAVAVPRDGPTLEALLALGLAHGGPFALRYPRGGTVPEPLPLAADRIAIGRAEVLREGDAAAVLAVGPVVYEALAAAETLSREGVEVAVLDGRFVKPLDREAILGLARRTGRLLTVEEGTAQGGFGGAVLELLARSSALGSLQVKVLGLPDDPVAHGPAPSQREICGLCAAGIASALRALMGEG